MVLWERRVSLPYMKEKFLQRFLFTRDTSLCYSPWNLQHKDYSNKALSAPYWILAQTTTTSPAAQNTPTMGLSCNREEKQELQLHCHSLSFKTHTVLFPLPDAGTSKSRVWSEPGYSAAPYFSCTVKKLFFNNAVKKTLRSDVNTFQMTLGTYISIMTFFLLLPSATFWKTLYNISVQTGRILSLHPHSSGDVLKHRRTSGLLKSMVKPSIKQMSKILEHCFHHKDCYFFLQMKLSFHLHLWNKQQNWILQAH